MTVQEQREALINFEEVEVEGEILDNTIMVSDDVGVVLRLLKVEDTKDVQDMPENEVIFYLLNKSIDRIFDAESVYERTDISDADVDEFIENLTFAQLGQLSEYFEKTPKLTKEVSFKCEICGTQQSRVLEGLQNFF